MFFFNWAVIMLDEKRPLLVWIEFGHFYLRPKQEIAFELALENHVEVPALVSDKKVQNRPTLPPYS